LNTADFVTLQKLTRRGFSFGVSQQDSVFSTDWSSQSSVQEADLIGKHAWINVRDVRDLREIASAFLEARRKAPFTTSTCLFLPKDDACRRVSRKVGQESWSSKKVNPSVTRWCMTASRRCLPAE
jgi:hypothetical protein